MVLPLCVRAEVDVFVGRCGYVAFEAAATEVWLIRKPVLYAGLFLYNGTFHRPFNCC